MGYLKAEENDDSFTSYAFEWVLVVPVADTIGFLLKYR